MSQEDAVSIQVLLASTHTIFRAGLRNLLDRVPDLRVVGEAGEAVEVLRLVAETQPDVVLLDSSLRGLTAMKPHGVLRMLFSRTPTLLLSSAVENLDAAEALREGAGGLALKDSSAELLIQGIRNVAQGQYWLRGEAVSDRWTALSRAAQYARESQPKSFGLTAREFEVVQHVVWGCSNKEIALQLSICDDTVKHHLSNIFNKIGVYNRLELALFAIHHGIGRGSRDSGKTIDNEG